MHQSLAFPDFSKSLINIKIRSFFSPMLRSLSSEEVLAPHKDLCTREDFMSVLHVYFTPRFKLAQLKLYNYTFCTMTPFVIYADFECIIEPLGRQAKNTMYFQKHKGCAAVAILCLSLGNYNQLTVT